MRIHICLYLNNQEVYNINDVKKIEFYERAPIIVVTTNIREYVIHKDYFDKIEVDYI